LKENAEKIKLIAVVGPTASGKTAAGVYLASQLDGEVISADSMQIYKGMDIGSAKPSADEMQGIPHHLIDFLDPNEIFSVAKYVKLAHEKISDVSKRGKQPILVGGTGLYINSLVNNIIFSEVEENPVFREEMLKRAESEGSEALLAELFKIDPDTSKNLNKGDLFRIIRALEVYKQTGKTMSEYKEASLLQPSVYSLHMVGINYRSREKLYEKINRRVDIMLERGLLSEAEEVITLNKNATAVQAIGYKELAPFIHGLADYNECVENLKRETRRYAKRQLTWFRRDSRINWYYADEYESPDFLFKDIMKNLV